MKGGWNLLGRTTSSSALEWPCSFGSSAKCSPVSGVHIMIPHKMILWWKFREKLCFWNPQGSKWYKLLYLPH